MKKIISALLILSSFNVVAHEIEGVQMLKGSLSTDIRVNSIKTACRVKIDDVKNLMEEDAYGNPAYKAKVKVWLKGGDFLSSKKVKFKFEAHITNLFSEGVRDLEYKGEGLSLKIKSDGRLSQVSFPYQYRNVVCNF